ncbi:hypothetical protein F1737_00070 [Methanoplanus sp. FWC-SCC4]|uniref:Uncharacterized protein n=1 Tax=Methanochimaera problematica TaxID=2609417 RepID=A0AA97I3G3_9EURY|nr:hypothetical protein [Methanoplanus sp. FWC-SCC4]WOF15181.1 hypothetical protein F1737_00070 [Methanoplanus sp. FWC-SCC4]
MGLNIRRVDFSDWIIQTIPKKERQILVDLISQNIEGYYSGKFPYDGDDEYPRIGSYGSYNIFRTCLQILTGESMEIDSDYMDEYDIWAVNYFKENLNIKPVKIPYVNHILRTGDCDTILLPILFDEPFEYNDYFFGSSYGYIIVLEHLEKLLNFNLSEPEELSESNPLITSKNIAKIIYKFLKEKPDVSVEFC